MTKEQILDVIKLLSALEGWSLSTSQRLPDFLTEDLIRSIRVLSAEVLK